MDNSWATSKEITSSIKVLEDMDFDGSFVARNGK